MSIQEIVHALITQPKMVAGAAVEAHGVEPGAMRLFATTVTCQNR